MLSIFLLNNSNVDKPPLEDKSAVGSPPLELPSLSVHDDGKKEDEEEEEWWWEEEEEEVAVEANNKLDDL